MSFTCLKFVTYNVQVSTEMLLEKAYLIFKANLPMLTDFRPLLSLRYVVKNTNHWPLQFCTSKTFELGAKLLKDTLTPWPPLNKIH